MRIAVTGSSGLIGTALRQRLQSSGHEIVRIVRRDPGPGEIRWDPAACIIDTDALAGIDAVVNLAGAGIGNKRWTDAYKREIRESRTKSTNLIAEAIASVDDGPRVLLSASGVHYYGDRGGEDVDESSTPGTGYLPEVVQAWEASTATAAAAGVRVVVMRNGVVLSALGGALKEQLWLFKLGLGGRVGGGHQWQSWITIDDEVAAIEHLLAADVTGPVNMVSPNPVTNRDFAGTLARVLKRPAFLPIPAWGPKLVFGSELVETLLLQSQKARPGVLLDSGFRFAHEHLEPGLRAVLDRPL